MLLCRNVNTLQRSQKTMTPQGEEGLHTCVCSCCMHACVQGFSVRTCSCVGGCSNSTTGSGRRTTEVKREGEKKERRESRPWQNWRDEISVVNGIKGEQVKKKYFLL